MNPTRRRVGAALAAVVTASALVLATPLAALAHVTIDESTASPGEYALLTLRVPNESATADTVGLTLALPVDTPFTSVRTVPVPGWSAEIVRETLPDPVTVGDTTITEAATRIVWTADAAAGIRDGELGLFPVSLGPVPDTGRIVLPVTQDYSDGTSVAWADTAEGAEHPAPVLYVNDAPAADHHGSGPVATAAPEDCCSAPAASSDSLARALGVGGLALGAAALVVAGVGRRRRADAADATADAADAAVSPAAPEDAS